jgi:hypothetical protein
MGNLDIGHFASGRDRNRIGPLPAIQQAIRRLPPKARGAMTKTPKVYAIEVRRSAASTYGEAKALLRSAGRVRIFSIKAAAEAEAQALQDAIAVDTVTYHVIELPSEPEE